MFNHLGDLASGNSRQTGVVHAQDNTIRTKRSAIRTIGWGVISLFSDERTLLKFIGFLTATTILSLIIFIVRIIGAGE